LLTAIAPARHSLAGMSAPQATINLLLPIP